MKKITYLGLAIAALVFSATAYCKEIVAPPPKLGQPLELKFRAVDGREVDLSALKGKVVLIDFWATWCGPCVAEVPHVKSAYEKYHDQGFEIIGISLDEQKAKLTNFIEKKSMPWPQHFDGKAWQNEFAVKYGISGVPEMWLVDKQGNLYDTNARINLVSKVAMLLGNDAGNAASTQTVASDIGRAETHKPGSTPAAPNEASTQDTAKDDAQKSVAELVAEFEKAHSREAELNQKIEDTNEEDEVQKLEDELETLQEKLTEKCAAMIQQHPQAPEIFPVLKYVLLEAEDVDSELSTKACDVFTDHHAASKQAGEVCVQLYERYVRGDEAENPSLDQVEKLANAVMKKSKHDESRGLATLTLADVLMSRADACDVKADVQEKWLKEAKDLLKTVVKKHASIALPIQAEDSDDEKRISGDIAKKLLFEIDNLMPGKTAPPLEGAYLDGQAFKLSDLKGNVVVVQFWDFGIEDTSPETLANGRSLVTKMDGKPFVMIAINGDDDLEELEQFNRMNKLNWLSVDDIRGDDRPDLSKEWNVRHWPTTYIIDHKGVIRHKWVNASPERLLGKEIEDLVNDAERSRKGKPPEHAMQNAAAVEPDASKYIDDEELMKNFTAKLTELAGQNKCLKPEELKKKLHATTCTLTLPPASNQELSPEDVYERCLQSVFVLGSVTSLDKNARNCDQGRSATAFALTSDGVLVTNRHVFEQLGTERFGAMNFKGEVFPVVDILAVSREADIAIIRVAGMGFTPLHVAPDAKVGAWVGVLSHPGSQFFTFTQGHVTRFTKSIVDNKAEKWMAITAEYACGSSGAPVLNRYGAVVGVATMTENIDYPEDDNSDEDGTTGKKPAAPDPDEDEQSPTVKSGTVQMIVKSTVPSQAILKLIRGVK